MGLLDQVIGGVLGSRGGSGRSQLMMALLALLASRAMSGKGGGLGDLGGALGNLPGGLGGLADRFRQNGFEDVIKSWIGTGQNQPISPDELQRALGPDAVTQLSRQTGMPQADLLSELSEVLPDTVDRLTPNGELPDEQDLASDRLPGPER